MNLAYRLRPATLKEFIGQSHIVGENGIIQHMLLSKKLFSMILWGPPGSGKTTLAHIIAEEIHASFFALSGVSSGKADLQKIIENAQEKALPTIIFIDEIHRWNKAQQDVLLPYVENGLITLIGATTENPSFEINSALLSRCRVFVLKSLQPSDLEKILRAGLTDAKKGLGTYKKTITTKAKELLIRFSGGDARILLNALEIAITTYKKDTNRRRNYSGGISNKICRVI